MSDNRLVEARLRRVAKSKGLKLMKSRCRTPRDPSYGGYMLVDVYRNYVVEGAYRHEFDSTLDQIAAYLEFSGLENSNA